MIVQADAIANSIPRRRKEKIIFNNLVAHPVAIGVNLEHLRAAKQLLSPSRIYTTDDERVGWL